MYPVILNLKNKPVVVIGGGKVAARKIKGLVRSEACVTVVSPSLDPSIDLATINWVPRTYQPTDLLEACLIFACVDDNSINEQIQLDAAPTQWVNVVSNKEVADFYNMAVLDYDGLSIGISTNGVSPSRAKQTRKQLEIWLKEQNEV